MVGIRGSNPVVLKKGVYNAETISVGGTSNSGSIYMAVH
jgi:hypothetical protein